MKHRVSIIFLLLLCFIGLSFAQQLDEFFEPVNYKGAFGTTNWALGWTALDHYQILAPAVSQGANVVTITDDSIQENDTLYWTADNTYLLEGRVFAESGSVLNIEAGTVVKGAPGDSIDASVLIISRGAKIYAEGTADRPIIFTAESDDLADPTVPAWDTRGLWGGLIILGNAPINNNDDHVYIEGIPEDPRGEYGGDDPDDNSGVFRYVSIRHGGISIGFGNEINGLTMGGVGRGTTLEYIEVYANLDDGFEWFGGTVNAKHLIAAFCGDDSYDHDEGLRGKMQFLFAIQHPDVGNMLGEHDGAPSSDVGAEPYAHPIIYNCTFIGSGQNSTNPEQERIFRIRENWGGEYKNSIFGDYNGYGLDIEDKLDPDSRDRLDAGDLEFKNNIWFKVNGFTMADSIGRYDYVRNYLLDPANGNMEADPMLKGISRLPFTQGLDPRPATDGPAFIDILNYPTPILSVEKVIPEQYVLEQNYPNPFNPVTKIKFSLPQASKIELSVYNILGQKIAVLVEGFKMAGEYQFEWQPTNLASGVYLYVLNTGKTKIVKRMTLMK
jgi:hypothetical protein